MENSVYFFHKGLLFATNIVFYLELKQSLHRVYCLFPWNFPYVENEKVMKKIWFFFSESVEIKNVEKQVFQLFFINIDKNKLKKFHTEVCGHCYIEHM